MRRTLVRRSGVWYACGNPCKTLRAAIEALRATMKKSDEVKAELEAAKAEYNAAAKREVYENPERTAENHDAMWAAFWNSRGSAMIGRIRELEGSLKRELDREIRVGDGVTLNLYSDSQAHTVIARTGRTLTIQRDKAIRDPNFKPEWVPGGFSAICTGPCLKNDKAMCYFNKMAKAAI